jgi:hypothetical protein
MMRLGLSATAGGDEESIRAEWSSETSSSLDSKRKMSVFWWSEMEELSIPVGEFPADIHCEADLLDLEFSSVPCN